MNERRAWIESVTGGRVTRFEPHPGGASRETWVVDVTEPDGNLLELVLRIDNGDGPTSGTELSLEREATAYRALEGSDVPVPRVHGVREDAVILDRVAGEADFTRLEDATERDAVADHFIEVLAALHRLDPDDLDLPGYARPSTPEDHALADLAIWERTFTSLVTSPEPLVRFGLGWLRRNAPRVVERTAFVQGDTGPGNFLYADGKVTAVLDWEFAHVGDPMDDLAWLGIRDHMQPLGDLGALYRRYGELSGITVDASRILYYRAFLLVRCAISTLVALERTRGGTGGAGAATYLTALQIFRKLLCETLAEITGVDMAPAPVPELPPGDPRDLHAVLLDDLNQLVLPAISEPIAARRAQGMLAILLHLQTKDAIGAALDADDLADLETLLGEPVATIAEGLEMLDRRVTAPAADAEAEILRYLGRYADRRMALWAPALGPMATKPFAPVPGP